MPYNIPIAQPPNPHSENGNLSPKVILSWLVGTHLTYLLPLGGLQSSHPDTHGLGERGIITYERHTSHSSNIKTLEIVCSLEVILFSWFDTGMTLNMIFNLTMATFQMTLLMNKLNKCCHGWWRSSFIGQNCTFCCPQLVMIYSHRWLEFRWRSLITIFVNLGLFRHFETITNIRTWIKSHRYWKML